MNEATMALADAAEDGWSDQMSGRLVVEVIDEQREPLFSVTLRFEPGALLRQDPPDAE